MGSTRFPGKPLARIQGLTMIEHVYRRSRACALLDEVIIATCDRAIAQAAESFGAPFIMTSAAHDRASDRVAEATARTAADIIVMIQGDEPLIRPEMIESAVTAMLRAPSVGCVNLAGIISSEHEVRDRNTIKVVAALDGNALYFSRQPIPDFGQRRFAKGPCLKQVCVIPFRRRALTSFATLPRGPLEELESIDMLRFLENGQPVRIVTTDIETHAVDVPGDLDVVELMMTRKPWPIPGPGTSAA
jgi:3-deoxy-manno-octulosonate cytidylyltransferase (CMP-KDO synthetase)